MPFSDLQQQLKSLGYGSQWQQVQGKLAVHKAVVNATDVERIQEHNKKFPEKHREAKSRWAKKRFDEIKDRIGKQKCERCFQTLKANDLVGQNRLKGFCRTCRKDLLG